jgi:hypothetical protein
VAAYIGRLCALHYASHAKDARSKGRGRRSLERSRLRPVGAQRGGRIHPSRLRPFPKVTFSNVYKLDASRRRRRHGQAVGIRGKSASSTLGAVAISMR